MGTCDDILPDNKVMHTPEAFWITSTFPKGSRVGLFPKVPIKATRGIFRHQSPSRPLIATLPTIKQINLYITP